MDKFASSEVSSNPSQSESSVDPNLLGLLQENLAMTREIRAMVKRVNTYVAWQKIFSWVRFLLIFIPLVIGVIYLPPLLREAYNSYLQLLKTPN